MKQARWMAGVALGLGLAAPGWAAYGYKAIAREFSRGASKAGVQRVAVLPFLPTDASSPADGWTISEKLTTRIVRTGRVKTIERGMLRKLLEEHYLAQSGMLDQGSLARLGKILSVDAVVTGSFVTLGSEISVNARLVHVETGVILAAAERMVPKEWFDAKGLSAFTEPGLWTGSLAPPPAAILPQALRPPAPLPVIDYDYEERQGLRDAPADLKCLGAAERVESIETSILDLKARFWATHPREGIFPSGEVPASTIADPELRERFKELLKEYRESGAFEPLSPPELKRFILANEKAFRLQQECGI